MSLCLFRDSCSDIYINYYISVHVNGQSALQNHLCKVLFASYGVQIDRLLSLDHGYCQITVISKLLLFVGLPIICFSAYSPRIE